MVLAVDVLGFALVMTIVPAVLMAYVGSRNSDTPGARWFAVLVCGIAGWSSVYGVSLVADDPQLTLVAINVRYLFTDIVSIAWFLLALEYVRGRRTSLRSRWSLLFLFPLFNQAVVWTLPRLVHTTWFVDRLGVFHADFGPWFYTQAVLAYVLIVGGLALFVDDYRTAQGIRRNQTAVLVAGALAPFVANLLFVAGFSPYPDLDLTPLAFLLTTAIFGWGLFRYRLLELLPVARKTVLDQMHDAVVTLDDDDRVVDINGAAAALFETTEQDAVGMHGREFFGEFPDLVEQFEATIDVDTEIDIARGGETRYFHLEISPVSASSDLVDGRVIVLRDITQLKEREQELDLLKQVLSRVLRHNIRNDVSVVNGYAEEIAHRTSGEPARLAANIQEKSDDIASRSQKAATIERVLTDSSDRVTLDLETATEEALDEIREQVDEFTVSCDYPSDCRVRALPTLPVALANLVENAVVHADEECPHVDITVTCSEETATVTVRDDGPGIPESELSVFEHGEETPLHHSSGVGLWLVVLIVRRSGGDVSFENDDGSVVRLTFDRAREESTSTTRVRS